MSDDALRSRSRRGPRDLKPDRPPGGDDPPVSELPNIGPTVAARLRRIDIHRRSELATVGALEAYRRMKRLDLGPSLRFDLFGLEAALLGIPLVDLSRRRRDALARAALDLPEPSTPIDARPRYFVPARARRRRR